MTKEKSILIPRNSYDNYVVCIKNCIIQICQRLRISRVVISQSSFSPISSQRNDGYNESINNEIIAMHKLIFFWSEHFLSLIKTFVPFVSWLHLIDLLSHYNYYFQNRNNTFVLFDLQRAYLRLSCIFTQIVFTSTMRVILTKEQMLVLYNLIK